MSTKKRRPAARPSHRTGGTASTTSPSPALVPSRLLVLPLALDSSGLVSEPDVQRLCRLLRDASAEGRWLDAMQALRAIEATFQNQATWLSETAAAQFRSLLLDWLRDVGLPVDLSADKNVIRRESGEAQQDRIAIGQVLKRQRLAELLAVDPIMCSWKSEFAGPLGESPRTTVVQKVAEDVFSRFDAIRRTAEHSKSVAVGPRIFETDEGVLVCCRWQQPNRRQGSPAQLRNDFVTWLIGLTQIINICIRIRMRTSPGTGPDQPQSKRPCGTDLDDAVLPPPEAAFDVEVYRALADSSRLHILRLLMTAAQPRSVTEVAQHAQDIDFSVVARHLKVLARAGLLVSYQKGRRASYSVNWPKIEQTYVDMANWVQAVHPR